MEKFDEYLLKYQGLHDGSEPFMVGDKTKKSKMLFDGSNFFEKLIKPFDEISREDPSFTVLDYGCGKALHLQKPVLDGKTFHERYAGRVQNYYCYDPGYKIFEKKPSPGSQFDYVICADVMEHIPEEYVDDVLREIGRYTTKMVFFSISGDPAYKSFGDGENLHCTMRDVAWWKEKILNNVRRSFYLVHTQNSVERTVKMKVKKRGTV